MKKSIDELFRQIASTPGYCADHRSCRTRRWSARTGRALRFHVEPHRKHCLVHGLDDIGLTLQAESEIRAFEASHRAMQPWLFKSNS